MKKPVVSPTLILIIGIFAASISAILVRSAQNEGAPSLVIAAWRLTIAFSILLPLCIVRQRNEVVTLSKTDWTAALLSGICLAIHFATWISSIEYTSISASTLLGTTTPIWVAIASPLLLKESVSRPVQIGIVLALIGSVISMFGGEAEANSLLGNGLALAGGVSGGAYMLFGRALRRRVSILTYITIVYGMAAVVLIMIAVAAGHALFGYTPLAYLLFLLLAIFPQLIGHSSFNYALGYLPAAYVAFAVICEPIGSSIFAVMFFQEIPTLYTMVGGVFILVGVVIASLNAGK